MPYPSYYPGARYKRNPAPNFSAQLGPSGRVNSSAITASATTALPYGTTLGVAALAGDLIVVAGATNGTHATNGMSVYDDKNGIQFTTIGEIQNTNASSRWGQAFAFVTPVDLPSTTKIWFTPYAGSTLSSFVVDIFRGWTATQAVTKTDSSSGVTGFTAWAPGFASRPVKGSLAVAFFSAASTGITISSPYNPGSSTTSNEDSAIGFVTATGDDFYSPTAVLAAQNSWGAINAAFLAGFGPVWSPVYTPNQFRSQYALRYSQMYRWYQQSTVVVAATGQVALSGVITGSSLEGQVPTSSLTLSEAVAGTSSGISTDPGTLSEAVAVAGSAQGVSVESGNLTTGAQFVLAGVISGSGQLSAGLTESSAVSGQVSAVSPSSGTLSEAKALAGSLTGSSADPSATPTGTLTESEALAGQVKGTSADPGAIPTGSLTEAVAVAGLATGSSVDTGNLTTGAQVVLQGLASGISTVSGSQNWAKALAGVVKSSYQEGTQNWVANAEFETGLPPWQHYATSGSSTDTQDNTTFFAGANSLHVSSGVAVDSGELWHTPVLPAGTYYFSVMVKTGAGVTNACAVIRENIPGFPVRAGGHQNSANIDWTEFSGSFVANGTSTFDIIIGLGSYGATSSGDVWYDQVRLTRSVTTSDLTESVVIGGPTAGTTQLTAVAVLAVAIAAAARGQASASAALTLLAGSPIAGVSRSYSSASGNIQWLLIPIEYIYVTLQSRTRVLSLSSRTRTLGLASRPRALALSSRTRVVTVYSRIRSVLLFGRSK